MNEKKLQIDLEHLERSKQKILQEVSEVGDAYMKSKYSYKGIRPVLAVFDGRSIPTWLPANSENELIIEFPTSPTEALMCEFFFDMSDEEVAAFLDAEEQMQPLREQLRVVDTAINAILNFIESSPVSYGG